MEDYEIIQRCIAGEKELFAELVGRYKNLVYSVIVRMISDIEEANDVAQEVFVKIYKNLDKYQPTYRFSTWVIRITTNTVIDHQRKKRHQMVSMEELSYEVAVTDSPEQEFIAQEKRKVIMQMVNELPDMYKVPVVLYHQQGLSYQEIAEVINEPLSKVKNRIFRARKMLKERIIELKEGGVYEM